ncbi:MAG: hypothetical protein DRJ42_30060 [Deltaproteobacteria bacterium]|nr:MAG: hypothetical protein DRJ42_30060 [Deltaproteobacteria bacterium]
MSLAALPLWAMVAALCGTAIVVLLLYLLRRTPRITPVSNVAFWLEAMQRARPRVLSSTKVPLISLLLTLLVALVLAGEIGSPRFGQGVRGTTVVVVAAGASMNAVSGGRLRIDRARDEARTWIERASGTGEVAVIRAGIRPTVLSPLGEDPQPDAILEGLTTDDGPADIEAAVGLADAIIAHRSGPGQILVIGDRAAEGQTRAPMALVPIGAIADSLGITRLTARRDPLAVGEYSVHVEVASFTSREGRARLLVRDRDVTIFDQPFRLTAGERQTFVAEGFSSQEGEVTASLEDIEIAGSEDALQTDDVAYAVAPALERTRVLLIGDDSPMLAAVLSAHSGVELSRAAALSESTPGNHDVLIFDGVDAPADLRHPGVLAFGAAAAGLTLGDRVDAPRITATLSGHEALGGVRLSSVRVEGARALAVEPSDQVLARAGEVALMAARERGGRRALVFGFRLDETDLGERVAFPLLIHHALRWLAAYKTDTVLPDAPGSIVRVPADTPVLDPAGEAAEAHAGLLFDTEGAGIYHVGERAIAVSGAETAAAIPAPLLVPGSTSLSRLPPLTTLLAMFLLLVFVLEWWLLNRGTLG